jgi:hypothetical protein
MIVLQLLLMLTLALCTSVQVLQGLGYYVVVTHNL